MPKKTAMNKRSRSEMSLPALKLNISSQNLGEKVDSLMLKYDTPNSVSSYNSQSSLGLKFFNKKFNSHLDQYNKNNFRSRRNTLKLRRSEIAALQLGKHDAKKHIWRLKEKMSMTSAEEIELVNTLNALEPMPVLEEASNEAKIDPIKAKMDFLENFKDLPNLSDISPASSGYSLIQFETDTERNEEAYTEYDATNYDMSSKISNTSFEQEKQHDEQEEISVESTNFSDMMEYMSESLLASLTTIESPDDTNVLISEKPVNEGVGQQLLDFEEPVLITSFCSETNLDKELIHRVIVDSVELYLNNLIDKAVNQCESYEVQLSRNCDKKKLKRELLRDLEFYRTTRSITEFLNRRMVEYFLRKRIFYPLTPTKHIYETRFIKALTELDYALEKEKQGRTLNEGIIQDLKVEESQTRVQLEENLASFETLVRSTLLSRDEFQAINKVVEKQIYIMNEVRGRIRKLRQNLLLTQHSFAILNEKLDNVNNLGSGLTVQQYITTQEEVKTMSKKLEECNMDWKRLFEKVNSSIHSLAHFRLKKQMLILKLNKAREGLLRKKTIVKDLSEIIYRGNLEHNRLHVKIIEYKTANFLLHYPHLLLDYDKTVEIVHRKTENVQNLKIVRDNLIKKIAKLESSFSL